MTTQKRTPMHYYYKTSGRAFRFVSLQALILALLALPSRALAQNNLVVNGSAVTASGTHYENYGSAVPLAVSGSLGVFTGSNIVLTGTSNGVGGVTVGTRGTLNLANSTINAKGAGVAFSGTSSGSFNI
jgi:hypothetical protein